MPRQRNRSSRRESCPREVVGAAFPGSLSSCRRSSLSRLPCRFGRGTHRGVAGMLPARGQVTGVFLIEQVSRTSLQCPSCRRSHAPGGRSIFLTSLSAHVAQLRDSVQGLWPGPPSCLPHSSPEPCPLVTGFLGFPGRMDKEVAPEGKGGTGVEEEHTAVDLPLWTWTDGQNLSAGPLGTHRRDHGFARGA